MLAGKQGEKNWQRERTHNISGRQSMMQDLRRHSWGRTHALNMLLLGEGESGEVSVG